MKASPPTISVIVPTYNRAAMLSGCVEAVLAQTEKDFELIIVSDGSTDETEEVVRSVKDPRIVFLNKENGGQASARNLGISNASGEYIALCDDDDRFYPNHLATLSDSLQKHPEIGLVYSDALWRYQDRSRKPEIMFSENFDKQALENFNYITPVNVLFRKSCLQGSGLFNEDPKVRGLEDWDFFLRLSDHHPFLHIKKVTSDYNVHDKNSFHPGSGYDYNLAFFLVRNQRFQCLQSKFGPFLFDHVDHMYPFHFIQGYLNNGKMMEGFEKATELHHLYTQYAQKKNIASSLTEIMILFSSGIGSFMAGYEEKAKFFFKKIREHPGFGGIKQQFSDFAGQYAAKTSEDDLKALLIDSFSVSREQEKS
jgi:glycosyltransferase involved in cell wall biosynthesis